MTEEEHQRIQGFLKQIRTHQLRPGVARVVNGIALQYREKRWVNPKQYEVLRRTSVATNCGFLRDLQNYKWKYQALRG